MEVLGKYKQQFLHEIEILVLILISYIKLENKIGITLIFRIHIVSILFQ